MDDPRTRSLDARLDRLERETRRWKLAAAIGPAAAVGLVLAGQALPSAAAKAPHPPAPLVGWAPEAVEAQRFVLRDPSGVARATLAVAEDGAPLLIFLDRDGSARAVVGQKQILLSDDAGGTAVKLLVNPGGTPALRLEKDGQLRAVLGMTGDGTLALGFYGQDGRGRALLDVGADRTPGLTLFTKGGKVVWSAP